MDKTYGPLFTPWKIGNVEIKNRIVLCPMGGTSLFGWMAPSKFSKEAGKFFLERAKNNVGLIIPGIAPIKDMIGRRWLYQANGAFKKLKKYMEEFHKTGAKLFIQLTAGFGRSFSILDSLVKIKNNKVLKTLVKPIIDVEYIMAAPSELPSRWAEDVKTRPLSVKEIEEMVDAFAKTAVKLKEAGVDGVEIHAVHEGYLLDQFTTEYTNKRTDEYGGSFENRYRFATDIVKAIKKACGSDFPVSLRYSVTSKTKGFCEGAIPGEKFEEVGRDMEESIKAAKYLQDAGYDMLNADNGTYDAWYWAHPPAYMPLNCNLDDVKKLKKYVDIPVVCAGRMEPDTAAKAILNGDIDAMGVARQFLVDSEWVTKLMEDRIEDIQPCICCHNGCFPMSHYKGIACGATMSESKHMSRCALNPQTMQGHKFDIIKTENPKNIAVIGGGVGGMEVARIATLRGHNVTIYEKTDKLGGVFIPASAPSFKEKDRMLLDWYRRQIEKLKIKVVFNTEITDITSLDADAIVVATGSKPKELKIDGIENSMEAIEYLNGKKVGNNVVIIGGGLTGCEIALDLYLKGKKPVIVEAKNDLIATKGICLANSSYLRDFFKAKGVPVYLESTVKKINKDSVEINHNGTLETVLTDNVIVSVGYNPAPIAQPSMNVYVVGDADKVGNLKTVIWQAWEVAESI